VIQQPQFGPGSFNDGIQIQDLSGQLDRLTIDPKFVPAPAESPMPFPERPIFLASANDASFRTLHLIEVCIFHHREISVETLGGVLETKYLHARRNDAGHTSTLACDHRGGIIRGPST
jgi:hypothetical protein